jgi:hypothetical protein
MMSYYLEVREGPAQIAAHEYSKHSFVMYVHSAEEKSSSMKIITNKGINVDEGNFVCILDYQKYLNVEALGESTIEKEISFWESSEYFCSMPRKKMYQVLREAKVRVFNEKETTFVQGQQMTKTESGSGVFVIRKG